MGVGEVEGSDERMDVMLRGLIHYDSRLAGYLKEAATRWVQGL